MRVAASFRGQAGERRNGRVVDTAGRSGPGGIEAFMLIQTEVGRAEVVAKQLAALPGVLTSEYVTGPYDVVIRVGADSLEKLHSEVVPSVQQITGITRTLTCPIASKAQA
jgi:DNA-binding Lrp family transcriptional regulator